MTRADIEHLCEVCESLSAQINASESKSFTMADFDSFVDRMLWAIHASVGKTARFDVNKFKAKARGENVSDNMFS
jgi:hypothetical protein